jgi:SlyX protein
MKEIEQRLIALEEKFSHQDYIIEEMNKVVSEQQQTIDYLRNELKALSEVANSGSSTLTINNLKDEVPPHY